MWHTHGPSLRARSVGSRSNSSVASSALLSAHSLITVVLLSLLVVGVVVSISRSSVVCLLLLVCASSRSLSCFASGALPAARSFLRVSVYTRRQSNKSKSPESDTHKSHQSVSISARLEWPPFILPLGLLLSSFAPSTLRVCQSQDIITPQSTLAHIFFCSATRCDTSNPNQLETTRALANSFNPFQIGAVNFLEN